MACVLADNHHHRLVDILPDRRQSALEAYFLRYSLEERRQVQTVTIDMYAPYYQFIRRLFPQAKIVIDRFHLVQLINRTLQQLRIASMKAIQTSRPRDAHKLKKQWKLLLKHSEDLDFIHYRTHRLYDGLMTEKMMVSYLINLCPRLYQAYDWLNRLKTAIRDHDIEAIRHTVHESHHYTFSWPLRRCFNAFERYMEGIDHACSYTLSNGFIEGVNNKIKLIKRTGYGYRRFSRLKTRVLLGYLLRDKDQVFEPRPLTFEEEQRLRGSC